MGSVDPIVSRITAQDPNCIQGSEPSRKAAEGHMNLRSSQATTYSGTRLYGALGRVGAALGKTSLQLRMRLVNAIFLSGIVAFIVITHQALQLQLDATDELVRLHEAERYAEDADRLHDTLRGDLYAALLAPRMSETGAGEVLRIWQGEVARFRDDLQQQAKLVLPPEVERNVARTRESAEEFLVRTQDLMELATHDQAALVAQLPSFEARFSELGLTFAGLNTVLSNELAVAKRQTATARDRANRSILVAAALIIAGAMLLAGTITYSIRRSIRHVAHVAHALAEGQLDVRYTQATSHEVGAIGESLNRMADSLRNTLTKMRTDSDHDRFNKQLAEAFEIADAESDIAAVTSRAMQSISPSHAMELLVVDAGRGVLQRVAEHPLRGSPGCSVQHAASCVAVRRGTTVVYADSEQLNACPYLRGRTASRASAVCVPLSFMGRSVGVLHATSSVDVPLEERRVVDLETLALHAGTRTGTVRAFRRTQLEALTDSLTDLLNRRALEAELRDLVKLGQRFSLIMADLDHFKKLNDTFGHRVGDRALRTFAEAVRGVLRSGDRAARWGGEEFVIVLHGSPAEQAQEWTQRLRQRLAERCGKDEVPMFTASYGVADASMWPDVAGLLRIADAALYVSKNQGRDRVTIGSPDAALGTEAQDASDLTGQVKTLSM
jgi:diguanylate cyclase (GGDEF)-like protein